MKQTSVKELMLAIRKIYKDLLDSDGDVYEMYLDREHELNDLYSRLKAFKIEDTFKPLLQEIDNLNQELIKGITVQKELLISERKAYDRQKIASGYYLNANSQQDAYFIDKKR